MPRRIWASSPGRPAPCHDKFSTRAWPRGHFLTDEVLVELARVGPGARPALRGVPDFPHNMPEAVCADLLAVVACGLSVPEAGCPQPVRTDFSMRRASKNQSDRLLAHIRAVCQTVRIHAVLVASRADVDSFVSQLAEGTAATHPLAQGWRKRFVEGFTL